MIRLKFLCHPTQGWKNLGRSSMGQWDIDTKKGAKSSFCA